MAALPEYMVDAAAAAVVVESLREYPKVRSLKRDAIVEREKWSVIST